MTSVLPGRDPFSFCPRCLRQSSLSSSRHPRSCSFGDFCLHLTWVLFCITVRLRSCLCFLHPLSSWFRALEVRTGTPHPASDPGSVRGLPFHFDLFGSHSATPQHPSPTVSRTTNAQRPFSAAGPRSPRQSASASETLLVSLSSRAWICQGSAGRPRALPRENGLRNDCHSSRITLRTQLWQPHSVRP